MFEELFSQMKEMMQVALADDQIFDLAAQTVKKSYDALVKAGFSEEQAMQIVANQGSIFSAKNNS